MAGGMGEAAAWTVPQAAVTPGLALTFQIPGSAPGVRVVTVSFMGTSVHGPGRIDRPGPYLLPVPAAEPLPEPAAVVVAR